jgi:hypothetical protein
MYQVLVSPKSNNFHGIVTASAAKRLIELFPRKVINDDITTATFSYKQKAAAYTAARTVRNRVHGVTARVNKVV